MVSTEKNLTKWLEAVGGAKPNNSALQFARSLDCQPEFQCENLWVTKSLSKADTFYHQEVFFKGFSGEFSHGLELNIECDCPARIDCKHILKLFRVYDANHSYLWDLFGLDKTEPRYGELYSRAKAVFALMRRDEEILAETEFSQEIEDHYANDDYEPCICVLCGNPSDTRTEHYLCHREEEYWADRQAA